MFPSAIVGFFLGVIFAVVTRWIYARRAKNSVANARHASENPETLPLFEALQDASVDDVMIPRIHIQAIDIEDKPETITRQLMATPYRFLPVFEGTLDQIIGVLEVSDVLRLMPLSNTEDLKTALRPAYYVPSGAPLLAQFEHFRNNGERVGLIVDEYGELEGLVTPEDLTGEVVLMLLAEKKAASPSLLNDGVVLDARGALRTINRSFGTTFPLEGPKTLSGLIIETLGEIPDPGKTFEIDGCLIEVLQVKNHAVRVVKLNLIGGKTGEKPTAFGGASLQTKEERASSGRSFPQK